MRNQKLVSIFMLFLISFSTIFQPTVSFGAENDIGGEVNEVDELRSVDAVVEENDIVEENETEDEFVEINENEVREQEKKAPVKNKGDPKSQKNETEKEMENEVKEDNIKTSTLSSSSKKYKTKDMNFVIEVYEHRNDYSNFSDYKHVKNELTTYISTPNEFRKEVTLVKDESLKNKSVYRATIPVELDEDMFDPNGWGWSSITELKYTWHGDTLNKSNDPYYEIIGSQVRIGNDYKTNNNLLSVPMTIPKGELDKYLEQDIEFRQTIQRKSSIVDVQLSYDENEGNKIISSNKTCVQPPAPVSIKESDEVNLSGATFEILDSKGNKINNNGDTVFTTNSDGVFSLDLFTEENYTINQLTDVNGNPVEGLINENFEYIDTSKLSHEFKVNGNKKDEGCIGIEVFNNPQNYTSTEQIDIPVEKKWNSIYKTAIFVELFANGKKLHHDYKILLDENNDWNNTFKDLPKYDKDGKEIEYTIKEKLSTGPTGGIKFKNEITGDQKKGFVITNTEYVDFMICKTWDDELDDTGSHCQSIMPSSIVIEDDKVSHERPDEIKVDLLQNGKLIKTITVSESDGWNKYVGQYPLLDEDGNEYKYEFVEHDIDGYTSTVEIESQEDVRYTFVTHIVKIHNEKKEVIPPTPLEPSKTNVSVEKQWKGERQDEVTINLLADGKVVDTVKLNDANEWKYTFTDLPVVSDIENEKTIEYTVEEVAIEGYEVSIDGNAKDGFVITNTRTGNIDLLVEKVWKLFEKEAQTISVDLLQNGKVIKTENIAKDNDWKHTFKDLPKYDNEGKLYAYTIKEQAIEGFEVNVTGDQEKGYTITNTEIVPPTPLEPAKTTVDVEKVWKGERQDEVTINLLADGEVVDTVKLSDANEWKYTFTDLPVVSDIENEKTIEYTVEEVAIEGYEVSIDGNAKDGFVVTNTAIEVPTVEEEPKVEVKKGEGSIVEVEKEDGSVDETAEKLEEELKEVGKVEENKLPDTATNLFNLMLLGGIALLIGSVFCITKGKKKVNG